MPNQPKTPLRAFRLDDDRWAEVLEVLAPGESASALIRDAVEREVRRRQVRNAKRESVSVCAVCGRPIGGGGLRGGHIACYRKRAGTS